MLNTEWRSLRGVPFEQFLSEVFKELGYAVQSTSVTGDFGVDLIATKESVRCAIQAKGFEGKVGSGAVQEVSAGMRHYSCSSCIVITNSRFTKHACVLAKSNNCRLIEGSQMRDLIMGKLL